MLVLYIMLIAIFRSSRSLVDSKLSSRAPSMFNAKLHRRQH